MQIVVVDVRRCMVIDVRRRMMKKRDRRGRIDWRGWGGRLGGKWEYCFIKRNVARYVNAS
jgi:hypothetical protein